MTKRPLGSVIFRGIGSRAGGYFRTFPNAHSKSVLYLKCNTTEDIKIYANNWSATKERFSYRSLSCIGSILRERGLHSKGFLLWADVPISINTQIGLYKPIFWNWVIASSQHYLFHVETYITTQ